jgi:hypothetical protein
MPFLAIFQSESKNFHLVCGAIFGRLGVIFDSQPHGYAFVL